MPLAAALTLVVVALALVLMMSDRATPDVALLGALLVLMLGGVVAPDRGLSGFGNPGMLTIAALFVVAAGLRGTGAVDALAARLLGHPSSARPALLRLTAPVLLLSAVLNNTTLVAALMPTVRSWARRIGVAPSRLLLPLSYASILGGTITLIGTSTNLVVAGMVQERLGAVPGLRAIGMFDTTALGLPVALVGGAALVLLGPLLLPDRSPAVSTEADPRQYTMEVLVPKGSHLVGRTIEEAGLRHLPQAFLMEIDRGDQVLPAVGPSRRLDALDRLIFVGDVTAMVDLASMPGLAAATDQAFKLEGERQQRRIVEAVVSPRNPLLGRSIREGRFRSHYDAVVIAAARSGERIDGRLGDLVLAVGDVLLLEAGPRFLRRSRGLPGFYLVGAVDGARPPRHDRALPSIGILVAMVAVAATGLVAPVVAAMLAAFAMVAVRACTIEEARSALDLRVLVAIAAALGVGEAVSASGLDQMAAQLAVGAGASSPLLALIVLYLMTAALTEVVTNAAAAALAVPVAIALAQAVGAEPMGFVFAVMVAASAAFLTPIGYQTNLMVYGPGGYRGSDYLRLGLPLSLLCGVTTVLLVPRLWPLVTP